jgi:CheY-like chemotaxis protein
MSLLGNANQSGGPLRPFLLLIDDDEDQLELFKMMFQQKNFDVVTSSSANEAEEILKQIHIDAVICDVNMPHVDGRTLITRLRKARGLNKIRIFSFTADDHHDAEDLLACGADEHYTKTQVRVLLRDLEKLVVENKDSTISLLEQVRDRFS